MRDVAISDRGVCLYGIIKVTEVQMLDRIDNNLPLHLWLVSSDTRNSAHHFLSKNAHRFSALETRVSNALQDGQSAFVGVGPRWLVDECGTPVDEADAAMLPSPFGSLNADSD
jgi:hypothetical protein